MLTFQVTPIEGSLSISKRNRILKGAHPDLAKLSAELHDPKYRVLLNSNIVEIYRDLSLATAYRVFSENMPNSLEFEEVDYFGFLVMGAASPDLLLLDI